MKRPSFEELDYAVTPLGELILRRREVISLGGVEVFEVKLDGAFLMSSLVNDTEVALAALSLPLLGTTPCDVLVGGLGLGYTAAAALDHDFTRSVTVMEVLPNVIDWHRRRLLPLSGKLMDDPRCNLCRRDFFAAMRMLVSEPSRETAFASERCDGSRGDPAAGRFHAILLDIDHSPHCLLTPAHASFYTAEGLAGFSDHLHPRGVFALWSADPPEQDFLDCLAAAFADLQVHASRFHNPLLNEEDVNYLYLARRL